MSRVLSGRASIFSRRIIASIVAVVLSAFALVVWMLVDIAHSQDANFARASADVVARAWAARKDEQIRVTGDYAAWGAAYENLHVSLSKRWAYDEDNFGRSTARQFGFTYIFVVSPNGKGAYAVVEGELVEKQPSEVVAGDFAALVSDARASADGKPVAGTLTAGGDPVIATAAVITPGSDPNVRPISGPPSILVVAQRMTSKELNALAPAGIVSGLHMASDASIAGDRPSIVIGGPASEPHRLQWDPPRPGDELIRRLMPWLAVAAATLAAFIGLMLLHTVRAARLLERSSLRLSEAYRDADHQAHHDQTTGLPNRAMLAKSLELALRRDERTLALLYLDLDRFKPINDTFGHPVGDFVLQALAERLRRSVRDGDFVARVGGDEFVVVAPFEDVRDVETLCERLIETAARQFDHEGKALHVGLSIGVALWPSDAESGDELVRCADIALYQAKGSGRGVFRFFSREMNDRILARGALENDIRDGMARGEFYLVFQPRYDTRSLEINSVEALLRWSHPVHGLIAPADFIPLAEHTGLIAPLGAWALRTACEAAGQWGGVGISVNVSPVQFRDERFVDVVADTLSCTGLAADRLELELTEGVLLEDTERAARMLAGLKKLGVRLSLDDFGTGYSSLGYLKAFPFDAIKIDKTFVSDLHVGGDSRAIVQAILGLGRALGMTVTAEGVETSEQLLLLQLDRCEEVQGFHLAKPQTAEQIDQILERMAAPSAPARTEEVLKS